MPSWLSVQALRLSGGRPGLLEITLSLLAGAVSMFVANVVVILMMAPVALPLARALKLPITPLVLMIGFSAAFMGSPMLLGDRPPQTPHSVTGVEFMDFFRHRDRPASFPILNVTFAITLVLVLEALGERVKKPGFDGVLAEARNRRRRAGEPRAAARRCGSTRCARRHGVGAGQE